MILSGLEIQKKLGKDIHIEPFNEEQLNPNSYNLKLHDEIVIYENHMLNVKRKNPMRKLLIPEQGFMMWPNKLYLGRTFECTRTHHHVPMIGGRSSIGRLGLFVNFSGGFGDAGFQGYWTLEMFCVQPIKIFAGMEICQIYYHTLQGKYKQYVGKYANNSGIQPSLIHQEFE
jgi:dCTP deaminase